MCDWVPKGKRNARKGEWNKIPNPNESAKPFALLCLGASMSEKNLLGEVVRIGVLRRLANLCTICETVSDIIRIMKYFFHLIKRP